MALTYSSYLEALRNLAVTPESANDSPFEQIVPRAIEYAEQRIYREFDFLCTLGAQTTPLVALTRSVALPSNVIVAQSANIVTPSTQTNPDLGTRSPLMRVGIDFLNGVYNSATGATVPKYYALIGSPTTANSITSAGTYNLLLGPWPDAAYTLEILGTVRPSALGPTNTTTFISTYIPDLLIAASMIFIAGYQRDYGQQSDDPRLAQSWQTQYDLLKASVQIEELRRKAESVEWSSRTPSPAANQPRDRVSP